MSVLIDKSTRLIVQESQRVASSLPYSVMRIEDAESRRIAQRFSGTIAAMIVVGSLIEPVISDPRLSPRRDG